MSEGSACMKCPGYIRDWGLCESDANALESQLSQMQGERDELKERLRIIDAGYKSDVSEFIAFRKKLEAERDALKAENEKLLECQKATVEISAGLARDLSLAESERDRFKVKAIRYEDRLRQIHGGHCQGNSDDHGKCEDWMRKVAELVLIEQKAFEALQPREGE